ncbi:GNAT family N-acetyltransferase [Flavobacteriaceae bacterium]|jgi:GNAT superfamily N-acetyltransferase|nr:GNAT family N-acetyltransferase [Flavobacteriaceae bacterium]|tara:strand:- start:146 stop:631 length:486 start_codon:yes stop_codon:yes gene_type:complete
MVNTTIRKANSDDVKDILRLLIELAVYEKEPDAVKVTEKELIRDGFGENPKYQCILAEADNTIVGLAFYTPRYSTWVGDTLHLEDLIVTEKMRGKGIGTILYKSFLEEARRRDVNRVEWSVLDWNKPAIDFYKKTGAIIDGLNQWKIVRMNKHIIDDYLSR